MLHKISVVQINEQCYIQKKMEDLMKETELM